jgi:regulatory protein
MRITRIAPHPRRPERVELFVDGALRLEAAAEIVASRGLRTGDSVDEAQLAELERDDRSWQAREAALHLLATRARSAAELARRLRMKGFAPEVVEPIIARLEELGMVDDTAFAGMLARDRVRLRPQGKRKMLGELRAKGVDEAIAESAVAAALESESTDETGLARRAAAKWRPRAGEDATKARRRLYGYLARRGFGGEVSRQVAEEVLGEE